MKKNVFFPLTKLHLDFRHTWCNCALFLLVVFIITGCSKQEAIIQDDLTAFNNISFQNGRLTFKDKTSFMDYQKWLFENQGNTQLIIEKNQSFGFKSMTEYYMEGMRLEEDDPKFSEFVSKYPSIFYKEIVDSSTLYVLPHSIILCYIANEDGIFQVGDHIYRIAQNYMYQTGDESKIEMLFLPKDQITDKDVKISLTRSDLDVKGDLGQRTVAFNNDVRFRIVSSIMAYTITDQYLGTAWYYDIRTNPQKRTLGVWLRAQLNTKAARGNGSWSFPEQLGSQQIIPLNEENTGLSQQNIVFCGGSPIDLETSYCPAFSRGRLIDGVIEYIYINWEDALSLTPTYTETHTSILNDPYLNFTDETNSD